VLPEPVNTAHSTVARPRLRIVAGHRDQCGQDAVGALADDGYGQMVRSGLDQLADRLAST